EHTVQVYPRGDKSRGLHGVFVTRSPMRPNPIAISELKVLAVDALPNRSFRPGHPQRHAHCGYQKYSRLNQLLLKRRLQQLDPRPQ
ncbi:hypothetical protein VT98_13821, partial [Candidatus Electrothrix communis]